MSIHNRQKFMIHHYKRAANLDDATYRQLLKTQARVSSAADPRMKQDGFDRVMAAIETILCMRVDQGLVPNPIGRDRYIRTPDYWRKRLPQDGYLNTRQAHTVQDMWDQLKPYLPQENRTPEYLARIIHKATGKTCGYAGLTNGQAACLLNALRDRLAHAIKQGPPPPELDLNFTPLKTRNRKSRELVPF